MVWSFTFFPCNVGFVHQFVFYFFSACWYFFICLFSMNWWIHWMSTLELVFSFLLVLVALLWVLNFFFNFFLSEIYLSTWFAVVLFKGIVKFLPSNKEYDYTVFFLLHSLLSSFVHSIFFSLVILIMLSFQVASWRMLVFFLLPL